MPFAFKKRDQLDEILNLIRLKFANLWDDFLMIVSGLYIDFPFLCYLELSIGEIII